MDIPHIHGIISIIILIITSLLIISTPPSHSLQTRPPNSPPQINSNSVLIALLDSHYTELAELVEKALLLQRLEKMVGIYNLTIFAPMNEALERELDPEFKRFLLEPGNLESLQSFLLFHIIPTRVHSSQWPRGAHHFTLSRDTLHLKECTDQNGTTAIRTVGLAKVIKTDDVIRPDGIIHGIERVLVPHSVQEAFNRRRELRSISAVHPEGAPVVDPRTHKIIKKTSNTNSPPPPGAPPRMPIYEAMAPGPSLAPAPAPGPGGLHRHFNGEAQVKDFIHTLLHYGGYNELADILVNLTSLATEMGKLISEGYVITVLAPNDEAMGKLTTDQLSEPGSPEQIVYYHIIPEYQTEESMYNSVRRFGKVSYDTLRLPYKVSAEEADGSVRFGSGHGSAYLFDPDIFTDGRISVQGIDGVLFPVDDKESVDDKIVRSEPKVVTKARRGKLLEITCGMLGSWGHSLRSCQ